MGDLLFSSNTNMQIAQVFMLKFSFTPQTSSLLFIHKFQASASRELECQNNVFEIGSWYIFWRVHICVSRRFASKKKQQLCMRTTLIPIKFNEFERRIEVKLSPDLHVY